MRTFITISELRFTCFNQFLWIRNKIKSKRLCRTDRFMIRYMLQQPKQSWNIFFLTRGQREEITLMLAAPTDNPKEERLACSANEIQEDGVYPHLTIFARIIYFVLKVIYVASHGLPSSLLGNKLHASKQGVSALKAWDHERKNLWIIYLIEIIWVFLCNKTSSIRHRQCRKQSKVDRWKQAPIASSSTVISS